MTVFSNDPRYSGFYRTDFVSMFLSEGLYLLLTRHRNFHFYSIVLTILHFGRRSVTFVYSTFRELHTLIQRTPFPETYSHLPNTQFLLNSTLIDTVALRSIVLRTYILVEYPCSKIFDTLSSFPKLSPLNMVHCSQTSVLYVKSRTMS